MDIQEFEQLVRTRQSCRSFSPRPVEQEKIEKIMQLTLLSPSACNSQPWSFIVLHGGKAREAAPLMRAMGSNKFVEDCPVFIVIVEEKANLMERLGERFTGQDFTANDIGIAAAHLVLAAKASGLDTCILGSFKEDKLKAFLNFGKNKRLRLVVALGYATNDYPVREKNRKTQELVTYID